MENVISSCNVCGSALNVDPVCCCFLFTFPLYFLYILQKGSQNCLHNKLALFTFFNKEIEGKKVRVPHLLRRPKMSTNQKVEIILFVYEIKRKPW